MATYTPPAQRRLDPDAIVLSTRRVPSAYGATLQAAVVEECRDEDCLWFARDSVDCDDAGTGCVRRAGRGWSASGIARAEPVDSRVGRAVGGAPAHPPAPLPPLPPCS